MSCFFIRLESVAASISPQDAVRELAEIATRLGLVCHSDVNDIEVIMYPNGDPELSVRAWEEALERLAKYGTPQVSIG